MNHMFMGRSCDLNIGNGKTVSAVRLLLDEHLNNNKQIFSNIKICGVDYTPMTPDSIMDILKIDNAVVLFDEIHALFDINHKVSPGCKKHTKTGLCYDISEFFRQVRKRNITTISTVQTFSDCIYRLRIVMQELIICEKFHLENKSLVKCNMDTCPDWHIHFIKQTNYRNGQSCYIDPKNIYGMYDSSEIVEGWQTVA